MTRTDALMTTLIAERATPGIVAARFRGTETLWSGAMGVRHVPSGAPMTVTTKARVASVSKVATALTLLRMVDAGKVDLDRDASDGLGFSLRHPRYPDAPITPRMVLSHTAGVRDASGYRGTVGETLESFFVAGGEQWGEGEHWARRDPPLGFFAYSNLGMGLAAQLAERAAGERFDLLARREVFDPLGVDCGFNWSGVPEPAVAGAATLYRRMGDDPAWVIQVDAAPKDEPRPITFYKPGKTLADYPLGTNGLLFSPQGGLRASVLDLVAIGQALTGAKPILSDNLRQSMVRPRWTWDSALENGDTSDGAFQGFGTGVHLLLPGEGCPVAGLKRRLVGHYGDAYGLLAGLWVDPETRDGFAWFCTGSPAAPERGQRSGVYRIEERMMQALAEDAGLA